AQAIAHSIVFPTRDQPAAVQRTLRDLDQKLREKRLQGTRSTPAGGSRAAAAAAAQPLQAAGSPTAVLGGLGELEVVTSRAARTVVIASQFRAAYSTDRAATFTASNPLPFPLSPTDPTLARGASGSFYLGTLARPNGSPQHLGVTGCTNAVTRSTDG